ncbi:tRNA (adenosine(37)-N6)-threonylcarbamoyltransferase complex dimerization subunit type 1 TsaB [Microvenator marinus]|uniref:tRNA (Adenosine(37)-N6)-threonylcarbamoyltransferase complex dimerization subunit type 1 TsaB n=1 Tax=Microvenator marinus TaxID=2600177 RepID=A0A5B8XX14_9DELT|nr:tRNA (adenosine(37)-N6)-threonylcarbamoyltransferase complex dimerization subunit type 1 TsaB [Microvenator marinus]QED30165.1 tRNA (adenosine(37)-N6)-threonylcarbamoyltransferase complex dimerization subunit type 1 TsaB [Microvenator marinus]
MKAENEFELVLALDTSSKIQTIALVRGQNLLERRQHLANNNHAASLLKNISQTLESHGLSVADLDLISVGLGPGSFTGLRVGLANAKALALSAGVAVVGVSSLAAMARPVWAARREVTVALADARRNECYISVLDEDFQLVQADKALSPTECANTIRRLAEASAVSVVGPGLDAYSKFFEDLPKNVSRFGEGWDCPSPYSLALLGREKALASQTLSWKQLEPNYIRPSDAKVKTPKSA